MAESAPVMSAASKLSLTSRMLLAWVMKMAPNAMGGSKG